MSEIHQRNENHRHRMNENLRNRHVHQTFRVVREQVRKAQEEQPFQVLRGKAAVS